MSARCSSMLLALGALVPVAVAEQAKPAAKPGASASGVFLGRSGKPMARAKLLLGQVVGDQDFRYSRLKLPASLPSTVCDGQGKFEFKGFPPGEYTIVYLPQGVTTVVPAEFGIKALQATDRSVAPGLRGTEFGATDSFAARPWGQSFTLLKGHTFYLEGPTMKIWNATVRRGQQGPYMEVRQGVIWLEKMADKSQIKFTAWSY